jgi:hypothetical protein
MIVIQNVLKSLTQLILKKSNSEVIQTPIVGKVTFFVDENGNPTLKNELGQTNQIPMTSGFSFASVFKYGKLLFYDELVKIIISEEYILDFNGLGCPERFKVINYNFGFKLIGFLNANLLTNLEDFGTQQAIYFVSKDMSNTVINTLFTQLPPTTKVATLDIRSNPGSATCTTSIATTKGYIVII